MRTKPKATIDVLLRAPSRFGLLADRMGATALTVAVAHDKKDVVHELLRASLRYRSYHQPRTHKFRRPLGPGSRILGVARGVCVCRELDLASVDIA